MQKIFFIDFDGTITPQDTCYKIVTEFSRPGWKELNDLWEKGEMSTVECARQTFQLFDTTMEELLEFIRKIKIDPYFKQFVDLMQIQNNEIYILSDGYEIIIKEILQQNGLDKIPSYANKLLYVNGKFDIQTPFHNNECGHCGTCKTKIIKNICKNKNVESIYIGDGTSDKCPVQHVDTIFAKEKLFNYCKENNMQANEYKSFKDIIEYFG